MPTPDPPPPPAPGTALHKPLRDVAEGSARGTAEGLAKGMGAFGLTGRLGQFAQVSAAAVVIWFVISWDGRQQEQVRYMREQAEKQQDRYDRQQQRGLEATARLEAAVTQLADQGKANNANMVRAIIMMEQATRRIESADKDLRELSKSCREVLDRLRERPAVRLFDPPPELAPFPHDPAAARGQP